MDVLIVIHGLCFGGAEKSLLSFLHQLGESQYADMHIDLLLPEDSTRFTALIPNMITLVMPDKYMACMCNRVFSPLFWKNCSPGRLALKAAWLVKKALARRAPGESVFWNHWKKAIPVRPKRYDVAISYIEGYSSYYVIDKVMAARKILWYHNDYAKRNHDVPFDRAYFGRADRIVTVSEGCADSLRRTFPEIGGKLVVIENISSENVIGRLSCGEYPAEYVPYREKDRIILSIGRISGQKRFDRAIDTALILKESSFPFHWFIMGEGPLMTRLTGKRNRLGLQDNVTFLGTRENPYTYIKHCDVLVQTSDYEGKSIVLDEAKILCKPIVATVYPTVHDTIIDGKTGIVSAMDPQAIAEALRFILGDDDKRHEIVETLRNSKKGNTEVLDRYVELIKGP